MGNIKRPSKFKTVLKTILVMVILILVIYIIFIFTSESNKDTFASKIKLYLQTFTGNIDTSITKEDNTILDPSKEIKIEESVGKVEVNTGSNTPIIPSEKKEIEEYADPTNNSHNSLYYNQLDKYGKVIYTKLKKESAYFLEGTHTFDFGYAFNELLKTPSGDKTLKKSFQYSINALLFDYPELFFIDIEKVSLAIHKTEYNNETVVYKVSITNVEGENFFIKGINTKAEANAKRKAVYDERDRVLAIVKNMKPYDKIKYIHDYIIDRTEYDRTLKKNNIYNITGPLLYKTAVCEGYAKTYKFLMDGLNYPTVIVAGKGYDDYGKVERHAWNYIKINNNWYLVDVTWDDPVIIGGTGDTSKYKYKYFLEGANYTKKSHVPDGNIVDDANFKYPALSQYGFGE